MQQMQKKSIEQNLTSIYDRDSQQSREEIYFNIVKAICAKPNIILNSEKLKSVSFKTWNDKACPLLPFLFIQHSFRNTSHSDQMTKRNIRHPNWMETKQSHMT